jgi:hypothetical protein
MIIRFIAAAGLAAALVAPGVAQGAVQTHEEVWQPAGKTVKMYRPLKQSACPAPAHHQAGKTAIPLGAIAAASQACAEIAATDGQTRTAAR